MRSVDQAFLWTFAPNEKILPPSPNPPPFGNATQKLHPTTTHSTSLFLVRRFAPSPAPPTFCRWTFAHPRHPPSLYFTGGRFAPKIYWFIFSSRTTCSAMNTIPSIYKHLSISAAEPYIDTLQNHLHQQFYWVSTTAFVFTHSVVSRTFFLVTWLMWSTHLIKNHIVHSYY